MGPPFYRSTDHNVNGWIHTFSIESSLIILGFVYIGLEVKKLKCVVLQLVSFDLLHS